MFNGWITGTATIITMWFIKLIYFYSCITGDQPQGHLSPFYVDIVFLLYFLSFEIWVQCLRSLKCLSISKTVWKFLKMFNHKSLIGHGIKIWLNWNTNSYTVPRMILNMTWSPYTSYKSMLPREKKNTAKPFPLCVTWTLSKSKYDIRI